MRYFSIFPKGFYPFEINGRIQNILIKDIVLNARFRKKILETVTLYDLYEMEDGERIEHVAEKLYGNADLYWVLMLLNERYDYRSDFPLSAAELSDYVVKKYGDPDAIHVIYGQLHYEDANGNLVDSTEQGAVPVSNYEYEFRLNESKRLIKVVNSRLISNVVTQMEEAFRGQNV